MHQVIQYFEDADGVGRIVQRSDKGGKWIEQERRDSPDGDWCFERRLGEYRRSGHINGNKSAPPTPSLLGDTSQDCRESTDDLSTPTPSGGVSR